VYAGRTAVFADLRLDGGQLVDPSADQRDMGAERTKLMRRTAADAAAGSRDDYNSISEEVGTKCGLIGQGRRLPFCFALAANGSGIATVLR
jgi:hypothetical protein